MTQGLIALARSAYEWITVAALAVEEAVDRKLQATADSTNAFIGWLLALMWSVAVAFFWLTLRTLPSGINAALTTHILTSSSLDSIALALAVKLMLAFITYMTAGR
jgi:hypothetical protein